MASLKQTTVREAQSVKGFALHTGSEVTLTVKPAAANTGFIFKRIDLADEPTVAAHIDNVKQVERATTLGEGNVKIHTVEHLLSAMRGLRHRQRGDRDQRQRAADRRRQRPAFHRAAGEGRQAGARRDRGRVRTARAGPRHQPRRRLHHRVALATASRSAARTRTISASTRNFAPGIPRRATTRRTSRWRARLFFTRRCSR